MYANKLVCLINPYSLTVFSYILKRRQRGILFFFILIIGKTTIQINEEKLRDFLSKGKMTVRHVRCIVVGCGGAGKSTLLRRLQNAKFKDLQEIKTTQLVDVHVNIFDVLENENTIQSNAYILLYSNAS